MTAKLSGVFSSPIPELSRVLVLRLHIAEPVKIHANFSLRLLPRQTVLVRGILTNLRRVVFDWCLTCACWLADANNVLPPVKAAAIAAAACRFAP